jgi:hypothetical protein
MQLFKSPRRYRQTKLVIGSNSFTTANTVAGAKNLIDANILEK